MSTCQPASLTKHLPLIHHPLPRQCLPPGSEPDESILRLRQISSTTNDGEQTAGSTGTTGTTLWLGGQLMGCYVAETLPIGWVEESGVRRSKRVLELGGGIGFLSLVLASLGYSVDTTDVSPSFESVLVPNIASNTRNRPGWGSVQCRKLDWFDFSSETVEQGVEGARAWMDVSRPDPVQVEESTTTQKLAYDYIITTDTIFSSSLTSPLLKTLRSFSLASSCPPILVALETRDPLLISSALEQAREMGFVCKKIAPGRVERALGKSGWGWSEKREWEGVEVWRWKFGGIER